MTAATMNEQDQKRSAERSIVYCLQCYKPQEALSVHLARVCMKKSTAEERLKEVQKAKASSRDWIRTSRTWNYRHLQELLPDRRSLISMVKELLRRGFLIRNLPEESDMVLDPEDDSVTASSATARPSGEPSVRMKMKEVEIVSCFDAPSITDCQKILRVVKPDFLRIHENLLMSKVVSNAEKTIYRYYCEALLVFRHMQRPGAVEALTDADWVERIAQGGRVVIGVRKEKASSMQIAMTQDEETCFQLYYKEIRPKNIGLKKFCQSFFTSTSGEALHNVSKDMCRFHEMYKLTPIKSNDIRKAIEAAAKKLPAQQRRAVNHYLTHDVDRKPHPQEVVDTAILLDSLKGTSSDDGTSLAELRTAGTSTHTSWKDFSAFLAIFPVSLEGQPPTKKQRVNSGFPEDRVFYDKWRVTQFTQREEYLLSQFTHCKPSTSKVARLIAQEGWKANYPKPEEIVRLWKPAPTGTIEADEVIIKCVSEQAWTGLAIKDFGAKEGLGVVATRPISKGDIVCDYHGKVIRVAKGMTMMEGLRDEDRHLYFFFKAGQRDLCIDAKTGCDCHPNTDTVGRRIKCCSKTPNLEPLHCVMKVNGEDKDVILFKALQDISIDTQLKFYSGVIRKSFLGLDLDWLDE